MSEQRISVAVRIRPPIERERYEPVCARKANDDRTIIIKPEENAANMGEAATFQFDYVFDEQDDQCAVYEESVQELVDHSLSGFNTTVFTYGQTGSGKTYTILGSMPDDGRITDKAGVFLRVFHDLFSYRTAMKGRMHITISLSALELYVEEVMDLLSNKKKLKLRETPEETLTMGITTVEVSNMADVVKDFRIANSFRSVTSTKMNDSSSRSHALFFIDLFQIPADQCAEPPALAQLIDENGIPIKNSVPGLTRSRIALVDLAGSERVKRSGVTGQAMTEAQAINKSLSTLGTVINAMYVQNPHIPFRESKLTKLLKPSFVETTSRLLLIGQVAPPANSAQESLGTLRFCDRVKGLKAGQVAGFSDPAEEERFLTALKLNEELTAEMRILAAQYYYKPAAVRALAKEKGTSIQQERDAAIIELRLAGPDIVARKEQEEVAKMETAAAAERDAEVEKFVLHMNSLIEEYEEVARAAKRQKKASKKEAEEREAEQEERLHETKKAKKLRLKLEETGDEQRAVVAQADAEVSALEAEIEAVKTSKPMDGADDIRSVNPALAGPTEEATHALVESFYAHATEQSRMYSLYVSRLAATGRQRAQVRRMKLLSSTLVTEGTLLYDILSFLVDRSVDIAEGLIPAKSQWKWHDVDGLSNQLLGAEQLYPPMLPGRIAKRSAAFEPCQEQAHAISFVSSDDSDGENSHHAAESRRKRNIMGGDYGAAAQSADDLLEGERLGEEERTVTSGGSSDTEFDETAPRPHASNWIDGNLDGDHAEKIVNVPTQPQAGDTLTTNGKSSVDEAKAEKRRRKHRAPPEAGEDPVAGEENVPPVATVSPASPLGDEDDTVERADEIAKKPKKEKKSRKRLESHDTQGEDQQQQQQQIGIDEAAIATGAEMHTETGEDQEEEQNGDDPEDTPEKTKEKKKKKEAKSKRPAPPEVNDEDVAEADANGKKLTKEQESQRYLQQVYDSPTLVADLIRFLRVGTEMMKHGRNGKPHRRLFWVSTARGKKELLWMEPKGKNSDRSSVQLDAVSYLQLGCFSKVFRRHPITASDPAFFRCFTVGLKSGGRTVDMIADTLPDFEAWVVGLSHLVGVDPAWGGKLDVTKEQGFDRLTFFEAELCEGNYIYPMDYLALKKAIQRKAAKTLQVLESCSNDAKKAHVILGGIHAPKISDKGALYLTKGELRFLLPALGLDIFRLSRVWMLLQQMNLVFDEKFTPATAFGVTHRE